MQNVAINEVVPRGRGQLPTLAISIVWFFIAVWLGLSGALGSAHGPPIGLGLAMLVPLIAFAVDGRFGHPVWGGLASLDLPTLIVLQTPRVVGVVFLVAWGAGSLPGGFALPAGLGDIAIGITAPLVAARIAAGKPGSRALGIAWTALGVLDLIVAVTTGITHASSPLGVFRGAITTDAMARYPFSLIPTFFVPLALLLHAQAARRLFAARR